MTRIYGFSLAAAALAAALCVPLPASANAADKARDAAQPCYDAAIANDNEKTVTACTAAIALPHLPKSSLADAYAFRGWAYCDLQKYDLAVRDLEKALSLTPHDMEVAGHLASARAAVANPHDNDCHDDP